MHVAQACSSNTLQSSKSSTLTLLNRVPARSPVLFPDLCYLASGGIINKACCQLGPIYCMTDKIPLYIPPLQLEDYPDDSPGWNHTHHCVLFGSCDDHDGSCTFRYSETYGCEFVIYSTAINAGVALVFIVISIARVIMAFE